MFGFEAIAAHNGWAMALAGALIVMAGLTVLSFVISQLHKILDLFEYRKKKHQQTPNGTPTGSGADDQNFLAAQGSADDITLTAAQYQLLAEPLGPSFQLSDLYAITVKHGVAHPHLTIKSLREAGILVPQGDGFFSWKQATPQP